MSRFEEAPGESGAPTEAPKKRRRGLKWFLAGVGILVSLALIVGGFYAWRVATTVSDIKRETGLLPTGDTDRPPADAAPVGSLNYLIMGSDSRGDNDPGRSDVLMLAHAPADRSKIYLVSFPRDLYVQIPGRGKDKINHAFAFGGPALTTQTVENLVGVRMDHVVKIDFEGFIELTEVLGGVTVTNKVASVERTVPSGQAPYNYPKGEITISGKEALAYVRQRKQLPNGDLDRAERQRAVMKAVLKRMLSPDIVANPVKFSEIIGQVGQYFVTDEALTPGVVFSTASSMRIKGGDDIRSLQAPITGFGRSPNNLSIALVDETRMKALAQALQNDTMDDYYAKHKDDPLGG